MHRIPRACSCFVTTLFHSLFPLIGLRWLRSPVWWDSCGFFPTSLHSLCCTNSWGRKQILGFENPSEGEVGVSVLLSFLKNKKEPWATMREIRNVLNPFLLYTFLKNRLLFSFIKFIIFMFTFCFKDRPENDSC